jgi:hypothetical protein
MQLFWGKGRCAYSLGKSLVFGLKIAQNHLDKAASFKSSDVKKSEADKTVHLARPFEVDQ